MSRKRPLTLTLAAGTLLLLVLLNFAAPFINAGGRGGALAQQPPAGWGRARPTPQGGWQNEPPPGGDDWRPPADMPNGEEELSPANRRQRPTGSMFALLQFILPLRIGAGIIGGLFVLLAGIGLWRQRKWGLVLTLIVAGVSLALTATMLVGRTLMGRTELILLLRMFFASAPPWPAITGSALAIIAAALALWPPSLKAYSAAQSQQAAEDQEPL